jgi:S-DNA-T family DNA segregation ATPase FtsK/SpoIIIE
MKDSSVGPTKLMNVNRCGKLLASLGRRIEITGQQRQQLAAAHAQLSDTEKKALGQQRDEVTSRCRAKRQSMLRQWDQAEEELTAQYERRAVAARTELNRMAVVFRRKKADESKTIERKVKARHQAVLNQFENRKNQPGQQQRKEIKLIDESLRPITEHVEWARALTIRRLDGLPEVGPPNLNGNGSDDNEAVDEDFSQPTPESVKEAMDTIALLTRKCKTVIDEMQEGAASKIVDSFYLPAGVAAFITIWAVIALLVAEENRYLWAAAGIIPAGILGFGLYLILLWPLKKMTRRLYPKVERIARAAEQAANSGRGVSRRIAEEATNELIGRRDAHLEAAKRWQQEQLAELEQRFAIEEAENRKHLISVLNLADKDYSHRIKSMTTELNAKAEELAQQITTQLSQSELARNQQLENAANHRSQEHQHLLDRLRKGVGRGLGKMQATAQQVQQDFPSWSDWLGGDVKTATHLDYLPIGSLDIGKHLRELVAFEESSSTAADASNGHVGEFGVPDSLPIVLHRRLHSALVIQADEASMEQAIGVAHHVLWRLLTGAPPSRAKLTLIDPLGRGQHFTSLMALADHDPSIIGHRVWTTDAKIEARLAELAHHIEDVLQSSLRDRFERIEDYNQVAGSMAEPYRAVAAVGFPDGLSREGYKHLQAIIDSGLRCGIFTVLVCDTSKPWPSDMPMPMGEKVLSLCVDANQGWRVQSAGVEHLTFIPSTAPPPTVREPLVEKIGTAAVQASRVEVPLDNVLASVSEGDGSTDDGISIAVGTQGANRSLALKLGEGVKQHVLIAGKTGSGKSTLLHSIITSGAYHYRPDQLHFYLLDFKKGVEFKVYAETGLPHARVIGIESEREFGRSVLQRLDKELHQRGEAFRAANVQELEQYRKASGQPMPRIMLVIDEFQELFVRDDRLAGDCSMLLDRLVRQGRSFGIHVILSSQSLAGAYSLPRATLGQMAVRIAMQCSESDAALVLSDDNTAARLISRPGEAIYNDAGGLIEGNQPFQVAWLTPQRHREILSSIASRDQAGAASMPPAVIFEGNRPCRWTPALADAAISGQDVAGQLRGLLGESVEIGPPVSIRLTRDTGRNLLVVAPNTAVVHVIASAVAGMVKATDGKLDLIHFDGSRAEDDTAIAPWLVNVGIKATSVKPRDSEAEMIRIGEVVAERMAGQDDDAAAQPPMLILIDQLERFRDLRQDESFNFSLDSAASINGAGAFKNVLKDGPTVGVFVIATCGGAETFSRWVPRASQHDFELRVLGQMNANDSSLLIDSPSASDLTTATLLFYDSSDGRITKFRQCDLPSAEDVQQWLSQS